MSLFPSNAAMRPLPYRKPAQGRDYWIVDDALPDPDAVRQRCLERSDWAYGYPTTGELWPGMRADDALRSKELGMLETQACRLTGASRVWTEQTSAGIHLNHNCVQVVGSTEGAVKPHTDSRSLCRYAGVLYLNPHVPERCGTSFFRQRFGPGRLGGNLVMPPHNHLVDALGARFVPPDAFAEDVKVLHCYNRLLIYKAHIIHSASAYWGLDLVSKRMTAVFFWMA